MRITNTMNTNKFLANLEINQERLDKYNMQLGTGRKMTTIFDDPVGVVKTLTARTQVNTYERYSRSVTDAKNITDVSESALLDINNTLKDIYELTVQISSDSNNFEDRQNIGVAIDQKIDHLITIGNSSVANNYIFGGHNTTKAPFTRDAATGKVLYNGLDLGDSANAAAIIKEKGENMTYNVGFNINMEVSVNGVQIFGSGNANMFSQLNDLSATIKDPTSGANDLNKFLSPISSMQTSVLQNLVVLGSQTNQITALENRYSMDILNSSEMRSKIEDADQGEAIMHLKMSDAIYRQTLAAGARVLQPSIVDFLK